MFYIAFLRAINVGGHTVKMDYLRSLFTDMSFTNVRTYIQTGNVFFESTETDRAILVTTIESHLEKLLGYEVVTAIRTLSELEKAVALNPFEGLTVTDDMRLCIAFISAPLAVTTPHTSPKGDAEIIAVTSGEAFAVTHILNGKPGNLTAYLEKTFKVRATVRFYGTATKILAAAKGE